MIQSKRIVLRFFVLASLFLFTAQAKAQETNFAPLVLTGTGRVEAVLSPYSLKLTDGRILHLSGIEAPDFDMHEPGPYARMAVQKLEDALVGKDINIYQTPDPDKGRLNRIREELAHVERNADKFWIQGMLLREGLARALPSLRNPEMSEQMYAAENEARNKKRSLWNNPRYQMRTTEEIEAAPEKIVKTRLYVIEGTVQDVAIRKTNTYLNFGEDWKTDFTVSVKPALSRKMDDLTALKGQRVRVRGWIENWNGPHIKLQQAAHLERLPGAPELPIVNANDPKP